MTVIRLTNDQLSKPLAHLINLSLINGIFPNKLKIAKIILQHIKGISNGMANYIALSILNSFSKIFDKDVSNQLKFYLEINHLRNVEQHGFTPGRSVTTATIDFIEGIINSVYKGEPTIGIFLDLSRSFNKCVT